MVEEHLAAISRLQQAGELSRAEALARSLLAGQEGPPGEGDRRALEYEIERGRRIRLDYSLTRDALLGLLAEGIEGFTPPELDRWIGQGRLDVLTIDGQERFLGPSRANLIFRYPEIRARAKCPVMPEHSRFLLDHARRVRHEAARGELRKRRFRITMTIRLLPGTVPGGEQVRCWMPFPREEAFQEGVELLGATPPPLAIGHPRAPHRALYFEQPSAGERETVFEATWRMEVRPRTLPPTAANAEVRPDRKFLGEQPPHVIFSDRLRHLARRITGAAADPLSRARSIHDWIGGNLSYSYAREYSTLRSIPGYVLDRGCGDCGQIALLFITLCRIAGVPARWQSGWILYPHKCNLHDWAEIHAPPHGWIPVDPDYGMAIRQHHDHLTPAEREELAAFYFGGMDAYRMTVNGDHGQPLDPPKANFRSDPVDFQRGELEAAGRNLYYDCFRYRLAVEYVDSFDGANLVNGPTPALTATGSPR